MPCVAGKTASAAKIYRLPQRRRDRNLNTQRRWRREKRRQKTPRGCEVADPANSLLPGGLRFGVRQRNTIKIEGVRSCHTCR